MIKKILDLITIFLLLFLLINADSVTGATKKDENNKIEKENNEKNENIKNNELQNTQNNFPKKIENIITIYYDSITRATKNQNVLELNEKTPEIKEIIAEKKEEKPVEKKDTNNYKIDLLKDASSDFFYGINNQKKSTMIIFKDNFDSKIPSTNEKYDKNILNDKKAWYKSETYIPDNINDFNKYAPSFLFDPNNIILPSDKTIKSALGEEIFLNAYKQFKSNNNKNAVQLYQKLVYYNYRIPESYYYLSWCYYIQRDYVMAINYMKEAIIHGEKSDIPKDILAGYAYQIGNIYQDLEDYQNSIIYFNDSINKDPSLMNNYNKLGISYYKIGDFEKSLEIWKTGMDKGDKNCTSNYNWLKSKLYK